MGTTFIDDQQAVLKALTSDNPDTRFYAGQMVKLQMAIKTRTRMLAEAKKSDSQHDFMRACELYDQTKLMLKGESKEYERSKKRVSN